MVIKPYFHEATGSDTFLNARVMKITMATSTRTMEMIDLVRASAPSNGPIESKRFTSGAESLPGVSAFIISARSSSVMLLRRIM